MKRMRTLNHTGKCLSKKCVDLVHNKVPLNITEHKINTGTLAETAECIDASKISRHPFILGSQVSNQISELMLYNAIHYINNLKLCSFDALNF
jgi:hypothetical protein